MLSQANPQTRFTILRPQSLFGPHDKVFIPRLAHMMHHYGSILLPHGGSALVDMTYYENAVHAMWLASREACDKLPSGRVYNITNGEHRTLRSIVQKLIDELNIDCRIRSVPYPMLDMIARSMERLGRKSAKEPPLTHYGVSKLNFDFTLDITRAQEELGYQPVITPMKVSRKLPPGYATTENCRANPARISPATLRQSPEFLHPLRRCITSGGNASERHNHAPLLARCHIRFNVITVARQKLQ